MVPLSFPLEWSVWRIFTTLPQMQSKKVTYILVLLQVATLSQVKVKLSRTLPHLHWIELLKS